MPAAITPGDALAYVERHGVVLASGKGPLPNLADAMAGAPIKGSWWAHAAGKQIFAAIRLVSDSPDVLVCRLAGGKLTFVHRRLWPALVRLAPRLPQERLARVREEHTAAGRHVSREEAFPGWVPEQVLREADRLDEAEAAALLGSWVQAATARSRP
jgi:hypothetical protein